MNTRKSFINVFPLLLLGLLLARGSSSGSASNSVGPPAPGTANPNNNPGNIVKTPNFRFPGEIYPGSDPRFRQFQSIADGYAAMFHQLQAYLLTTVASFVGDRIKTWTYTDDPYQYTGNIDTLYKIINTYAPTNENDTATYINNVTSNTGIGPYVPIDINNASQVIPIIKFMSQQENGVAPNMDDVTAGYNRFMGK